MSCCARRASTSAGPARSRRARSWVPANPQGRAAGVRGLAWRRRGDYFDGLIPSDRRRGLRRAFLDAGGETVAYLNAAGVGLMDAGPLPDYRSEAPGAAIGGSRPGARAVRRPPARTDFERVRPPLPAFTVLGGYDW